jgi:hypothetical protein
MLQFTPLKNKQRITAKKYLVGDLTNAQCEGQLGLMIPNDMVVIDIDSEDKRSAYYIAYIKKLFPGILITKSLKAGGYHLFFKTNRTIKRTVGLMSIFGWKFDILKGKENYIVLPDNYEGRKYLTRFNNFRELAFGWDDYDVMLPDSLDDVIPFVDANVDHPNILTLQDGERNERTIEWLGYFIAKGVSFETVQKFLPVISKICGLEETELEKTVMASLAKYSGHTRDEIDRDATGREPIKKFVGEDYVDLSIQLREFLLGNKMFGYDEATGLGYCNVNGRMEKGLSMKELRQKMTLYLGDKLFLANKDNNGHVKSTTRMPIGDRDALFEEIKENVRYNSREDIYKNIPKWDGIERINTFLKQYYDCDTNPNLFWLFMTSLVGMIHNPHETYVPYWFDFVSQEKGVGKTLLLKKLSHGWCVFMSKGRSVDDMYVNAYSENAIIVIDDECAMSDPEKGQGISYDLWKQFVTSDRDTFSRKNQQPESHPRSFIVTRTSNKVKTGYAVNERRQIVFESKLGQDECRILDLPDSYFEQLMAEAKVYYEAHGNQPYKLTEEDKETIHIQQMLYFNTERDAYADVKEYVNSVRIKLNSPDPDYQSQGWTVKTDKVPSGHALTWKTYRTWAMQRGGYKVYASQTFWSCIDAIAVRTGLVSKKHMMPVSFDGSEPEYCCTLYVKDTDVITPTLEQKEVASVSVLDFFEAPKETKTFNPNESEKELGAEPIPQDMIRSGYILPPEIIHVPPEARIFFEKFKEDCSEMVPTPIRCASDGSMDVTFGLGGAHFAVRGYSGTDIVHVDVNSMYPNIMITNNLLSRAVKSPHVFIKWVEDRLAAKEAGNKELADSLKLKINSVYGLMKSKVSPLYDPYYASSIAVRGQVLITILAMGLKSIGCEIININTDGIFLKPVDGYENLCEKWEQRTGLTLSHKKYASIAQADVNNYRLIDYDGNVINKGAKFIVKNN